MRAQTQELVKLAIGLKEEIRKLEYFDNNRTQINQFVDVYSNNERDYVHIQFNKGEAKPVDITLHQYSSYYSETLSIDLSVTDEKLDEIIERSQDIIEEFVAIYAAENERAKQEKIAHLEEQIAKLRGDVPVI